MSKPLAQAVRPAVLGVALAALVGVLSGQVKSTVKAMTLTPMDYIEIRQLVNRYAFALDTGSSNGYDYADLFAADGEFMRPYAKGRERLAALARGPRLGPNNTVHYVMNHVIEPTPDGAIGKAYLIELNWEIAPAQAAGGRGAGAGPTNGWDTLEGVHLLGEPLSRRRELLEQKVLPKLSPPIKYLWVANCKLRRIGRFPRLDTMRRCAISSSCSFIWSLPLADLLGLVADVLWSPNRYCSSTSC
jgi:hypothetical protein